MLAPAALPSAEVEDGSDEQALAPEGLAADEPEAEPDPTPELGDVPGDPDAGEPHGEAEEEEAEEDDDRHGDEDEGSSE